VSDGSTSFLTTGLGPRLAELRQSLGPALTDLLDQLLERHGWTGEWNRLLNPLGQPVAQLPYWTAEIVSHESEILSPILDDLAEAAIVGYLHVRVQDDLIDEGGWPVEQAVLLSEALLIRHVSLLARQAGTSQRFWSYFEKKGWDYCDATLLERRLLDPGSTYGEAEFDSVLRRSLALIIPSSVVLDRIDRWDLIEPLEDMVRHMVRSGQLIDDLIDAADDLGKGNHTWVVRRMGGGDGRGALLNRLGLEGGFDEIVDDINREVDAAIEAAARLDAHSTVSWLTARRAAVAKVQEGFFARLFGGLTQAMTTDGR
jgi:hypothetical protein